MIPQRPFARWLPLAAALAPLLGPGAACAQAYPTKAIRMVVPYGTGTATDALSRLVAQKLSEYLGQQVVVENQPGANGIPATAALAKSAPDGHSIAMIASNHVVNASLYSKLPYDVVKDFKPVQRAGFVPFILSVHPSLPVANLKEFVAFAKLRPGQINYASPSNGSPAHLATELLKSLTGVNLIHVPYKAAAQAQSDVIGGQIPVMFIVTAAVLPHIKAGRLKALGISSPVRSAQAPDIPTIAEAGVPGFEMVSWIGLAGPAGLAPAVVSRLAGDTLRALQDPTSAERIRNLGIEIAPMGPEEFGPYWEKERARWADVVKRAGAKLD